MANNEQVLRRILKKILLIQILNVWVAQLTWCDVAAPHKVAYVPKRDQA